MKQKQHTSEFCSSIGQALGPTPGLVHLHVSVVQQRLFVKSDQNLIKDYVISTALKGPGEEKNSFQTPRGWHQIRAKIGAGQVPNAVFVERRFTGEIFNQELFTAFPDRDWILTRIMWLSGLELGKNRLGNVDTMQRYIYIHGGPEQRQFGVPNSKGCIRMRNSDIIELFDLVTHGTKVFIEG